MNTNIEYIPVPSSLSLTIKRDHKLIVIKRTLKTIYSITWKALLYALVLTIANVII